MVSQPRRTACAELAGRWDVVAELLHPVTAPKASAVSMSKAGRADSLDRGAAVRAGHRPGLSCGTAWGAPSATVTTGAGGWSSRDARGGKATRLGSSRVSRRGTAIGVGFWLDGSLVEADEAGYGVRLGVVSAGG